MNRKKIHSGINQNQLLATNEIDAEWDEFEETKGSPRQDLNQFHSPVTCLALVSLSSKSQLATRAVRHAEVLLQIMKFQVCASKATATSHAVAILYGTHWTWKNVVILREQPIWLATHIVQARRQDLHYCGSQSLRIACNGTLTDVLQDIRGA